MNSLLPRVCVVILRVEVTLDGGFVAADYQQNPLDAAGRELFDHMVHHRLPRHGEHLLGL
jgi:hypothetical protein